ncbi:class I SAM-dependent methyltransferase [Marinicrinis sediminis]|uniref:Class I SAM-dependent methyltransferase n=1 Tax=Marinicrinis sediminis TaxID=1652465 RepID=A0ABW5R8W7_9BACL
MGFVSVLSYAQQLVARKVQPGHVVIDGTAGNGHDTIHLAKLAGRTGHVYAFDIQEQALASTRQNLSAHQGLSDRVTLLQASHSEMSLHIPSKWHQQVQAVMFNFGFLPGSNQQIVTLTETSIAALEDAFSLLKKGGILTAVLYPGHAGGDEEAHAIEKWATALSSSVAQVLSYRMINSQGNPPYLIAVEKRIASSRDD